MNKRGTLRVLGNVLMNALILAVCNGRRTSLLKSQAVAEEFLIRKL